jgi:hypothetical protein
MERIGEGLLRLGRLESERVEQVVNIQKHGDNRLFGEIAVGLNFISVGDLLYYLHGTRQSGHDGL